MIEDRNIREQLGFTEVIQMIDFSTLPADEVSSVVDRVKNDITAAIYEGVLRLGLDPASFDESTFASSFDETDVDYGLKSVIVSSINRLNWVNNWAAENL
jgi:hypothetical protein